MFIPGDQTRDLGSEPFNPPAVRRQYSDPGSLATHDAHGVVDAFYVAPREIVVAAKVGGLNRFRHLYSLPPRSHATAATLRQRTGEHPPSELQ